MKLDEVPITTTTTAAGGKAKSKGRPPLLPPFTAPVGGERATVKKVVLIFNPVSGGKRGKRLAETIVLPMFKEAGIETIALATERVGHATELGETCDLSGEGVALCALGGDGALSDVLNGFMRRTPPPPGVALGFLPGGTGNTFLHDVMGAKQRGEAAVRQAVRTVIAGATRQVDLSKLHFTGPDGTTAVTRYSMNIVTAGIGVDINAIAEKRRWMGPLRYDLTQTLEVMKLAFGRKMPPCKLSIDGRSYEFGCFVVCIMNNKHTGASIRVCPRAQLDDGKIDCMFTPRRMGVLKALKLDNMIKAGGQHINDDLVSYEFASQSIELATTNGAPMRLMIDGDILGVTPLRIEVMAKAFTLFTPESPSPS